MQTVIEAVRNANKKKVVEWQSKPLFRIPFTRYFVAKWEHWREKKVFIIVRKEFKDGHYYYEEI